MIAKPRYTRIANPNVKHAAMKKTNLQKKAEPLPEISSPLQIPKNQAPFLVLIILDIIF